MARAEIEAKRKSEIIDASMQCIHEHGIASTSLKRIAQLAGVTSGLILHYFGDKESLLEEVYRSLYRRLAHETLKRLATAQTPVERLFAILEAQVCEEMIAAPVNATWHAICAFAPQNPNLSRMERINTKRLMSNLSHTLKSIGTEEQEAHEIAEELHAMIYGLWSGLAYDALSDPGQARLVLFRYVRARIPAILDRSSHK